MVGTAVAAIVAVVFGGVTNATACFEAIGGVVGAAFFVS